MTTTADQQELMGIQEVADLLGVTHRTLRFYEDQGLIAPQRVGTTRVYSRREVGRMQLILRGKRLGFSIREIGQFLDLYNTDPRNEEQTRAVLAKVRERLDELEAQKRALEKTITELRLIEGEAARYLSRSG